MGTGVEQVDRLSREHVAELRAFVQQQKATAERDLRWLWVLREGLGTSPISLIHRDATGAIDGYLPLIRWQEDEVATGGLSGFVSLPLLLRSGVMSRGLSPARSLIDAALTRCAAEGVGYLELRHAKRIITPRTEDTTRLDTASQKSRMLRPLPATESQLWNSLAPAVRERLPQAQRHAARVRHGGVELLPEAATVVGNRWPEKLWRAGFAAFGNEMECVIAETAGEPVAAAVLWHPGGGEGSGDGLVRVLHAQTSEAGEAQGAGDWLRYAVLRRGVERGAKGVELARCHPHSDAGEDLQAWGCQALPSTWQHHHLRPAAAPETAATTPARPPLRHLLSRMVRPSAPTPTLAAA